MLAAANSSGHQMMMSFRSAEDAPVNIDRSTDRHVVSESTQTSHVPGKRRGVRDGQGGIW